MSVELIHPSREMTGIAPRSITPRRRFSGCPETFLKSYNRAIAINPEKVDFYYRRGRLYRRLGCVEETEAGRREMIRPGY